MLPTTALVRVYKLELGKKVDDTSLVLIYNLKYIIKETVIESYKRSTNLFFIVHISDFTWI